MLSAGIHKDSNIDSQSGYPKHFPYHGEDSWPGLLFAVLYSNVKFD